MVESLGSEFGTEIGSSGVKIVDNFMKNFKVDHW